MRSLNEKEKENALNEVRLLASIHCDYVIKYKEAFFDPNSNTLCIVIEFADGGDLQVEHSPRSTSSNGRRRAWRGWRRGRYLT